MPELVNQTEITQFYSQKVKKFLEIFKNYISKQDQVGLTNPLDYLIQNASTGEEKMYLEKIYLQGQERWSNPDEKPEWQNEFQFITYQLQKRNINTKLAELEMAIKQAEKRKDKNLVVTLAGEFQNTANFLNK